MALACEGGQRSFGRGRSARPPPPARQIIGAAWDDPLRCLSAYQAGARLPRAQFRLRVVQWTLTSFPDAGGDTNLEWLGCALSYLDADLLVLADVSLTTDGVAALTEVVQTLSKNTGATWRYVSEGCADNDRGHVVALWREDRVRISAVAAEPLLDTSPHTNDAEPACPGALLPALGAYVESLSGGLDFHLLATALADGMSPERFALRTAAWPLFSRAARERQTLRPDTDVVMAAALNTVGKKGQSFMAPLAEREALREAWRTGDPGLKLLEPADTCTQYVAGIARQVGYLGVSASMVEAQGLTPKVSFVCGALHCQDLDPKAYPMMKQVSNHCPVVLDLHDRDQDN